jgi:hypothetical protein
VHCGGIRHKDKEKESPAPYDLKHNSRRILLLFVSADDLKQENGQILLKIVNGTRKKQDRPIKKPHLIWSFPN